MKENGTEEHIQAAEGSTIEVECPYCGTTLLVPVGYKKAFEHETPGGKPCSYYHSWVDTSAFAGADKEPPKKGHS